MKFNKKKIAKYSLRTGTAVGALLLGLVSAYLITPSRKAIIDLTDSNNTSTSTEETPFDAFVNKYTAVVTEGLNGLHAEFENFNISFDSKDSTVTNNIAIDGSIDLVIRGFNSIANDIEFNAMLDVNYNDRNVPLTVAYADKALYFRLLDLGLKSSHTNTEELVSTLAEYLSATSENGGPDLDFGRLFDEFESTVTDKINIGNLISGLTSGNENSDPDVGMSFDLPEGTATSTGYEFPIGLINKTKEIIVPASENVEEVSEIHVTEMQIKITTDKKYNIEKIEFSPEGFPNGLQFGGVKITGTLNTEIHPITVYKPDQEEHPRYDEDFTYVEVINYKGWLKKLSNLLADDGKHLALSFDADLSLSKENQPDTEIGSIVGSIKADFANLIDLSEWKNGYEAPEEPVEEVAGPIASSNETINKVLNGISLGVDLSLFGQEKDGNNNPLEYANLGVKYLNQNGYIVLNEHDEDAVMRAKVDTSTINWMINEMPALIDNMVEDVKNISAVYADDEDESANDASSLFGFITDSTLVKAIKNGYYAPIIDVIKSLTNDNNCIYLVLDLSSIGLGDDATVSLTLDAREENDVITLDVNNCKLGSLNLDLHLENESYSEITVANESKYDSMSFLPSLLGQVEGILNTTQTGFALTGSVLDSNNLGLTLAGNGQLDFGNTKHGFGELTIDQYKYRSNSVWYSHKIALDVFNYGNEPTEKNVKFIYGDRNTDDNIKGKFTVQTVKDLIKLVMTFIDDFQNDERFSKFTDLIASGLAAGDIADTIKGGDYFRFVKNDLIKEIKQYNGGEYIQITVNGEVISLGSDLVLRINLSDEGELEGIQLVNLVIGEASEAKTINVGLTLEDYDSNATSTVVENPGDHFYDISEIKLLLEFGINTTKLAYYNLTADIHLVAAGFINADIHADVKILVDGKKVKLYGKINVPELSGAIQNHFATTTKQIVTEFTFTSYESTDPNHSNDVGGYFRIRKNVDRSINPYIFGAYLVYDKIYDYKATSEAFIDGDNILTYLLGDMLDVNSLTLSAIGTLSGGDDNEEKDPGQYTQMFTPAAEDDGVDYGYEYDPNALTWNIGINLGKLLSNNIFKGVGIKLTGVEINDKGYWNEANIVMNMHALVDINVSGTISLNDIDPDTSDWDERTERAYNAIVNVSDIPNSYLTDPNKCKERDVVFVDNFTGSSTTKNEAYKYTKSNF